MALTQIRLNQITGSAPNNFKPAAFAQGGTVNAIAFNDLSGSMGYFAQALANIHGDLEYGNQVPGKIQFTTANNIHMVGARSGGAQQVKLEQHDGTNASGLRVELNSTGTATAATLTLENVGGTDANAIDINATAGGIDVDAAQKIQMLSGDDSEFLTADTKTLFLGEGVDDANHTLIAITHDNATAANEKILVQNKAGTTGDAIRLKAEAGGVWIDADGTLNDAINIDSAGGIDVDSATAMSFATSDAAGDISFATAHTAGVAFLIDANAHAGSIVQVDAGVLDQNVTGATTLDGASLAQTLSSTYDLDAAGAITMDGASVSVGGDNDTVTITSKSTGGDTTIEVAATGSGHDLILKQSGNQDAGVLIQAAGTGPDAIKLEAIAGSIVVDVVDGQSVSLGKSGGAEVLISPHGTPGDEKILLSNSGGDAADSVKIDAAAGGVEVDAAGNIVLNSSAGLIQIGNDNVNQGVEIASAGQRVVDLGNVGVGSKLKMMGGSLGTFVSSSAGLALSGAQGQVFAADGAMTSGDGYLGMKFANYQEFATFRGKSLFNAGTTVVGALNALATSVAGTEPTTFKNKLSAPVAAGSNIQVTKIAGDADDLSSHAPQKMQIYYNGQQLLSGSVAEFTGGTCDYRIDGDGSSRNIKLNFTAQPDDLIQVWDFS